jgi:signal transduction histidine kinase
VRLRFRLVSLALSGIFVLLLVGLYAIDRTLSSSRRLEMSLHAVHVGAVVQRVITAQFAALNGIRAVHSESKSGITSERFRPVVDALVDTSSGVGRLWMTDSLGVVIHDYQLRSTAQLLPPGLSVDSMQSGNISVLARDARASGKPQLSRPHTFFSLVPVLTLIDPMFTAGRFSGFAGANIPMTAFERVIGPINADSAGILITAGSDTIYRDSNSPSGWFVQTASNSIQLPGNNEWVITVRQSATNLWLRLALWALGLATLPTLIAGVLQERRAAVRVSERSAELERLSTELLRANRAKSEFLANVSHELRTPLNAIVGFVDLLRDGVYGELAQRQVSPVERIAASATHLRHLVDQVLDIAKMAAGRLEVHTEPLALRPFVLDVVSEIESLVNERGLSLSIAVGASLPKVRTDPTHLRQILTNLLGNAVKYTTSGGIAVRARLVDPKSDPARDSSYPGIPSLEKTWIALQVADSGIGIAAGDLERIFEEFEQVDSGSRGDSVTRGTGLGLPISRRLARLLGGEISVHSELGHGSTFTLWLPVNPVDFRPADHRVSPDRGAPAVSSPSRDD